MRAPRIGDLDSMRAQIARDVVRKARRWSSCTCGPERVRWDGHQVGPFIDHAPGCPLRALCDDGGAP